VIEPAVRYDMFAFSVSVPIPSGYEAKKPWIEGQVSPGGIHDVWIRGEHRDQIKEFGADEKFHSLSINITDKSAKTITGMFTAHKGAVGNVRVWRNRTHRRYLADLRDSAWNIIRQAAWTRCNEKRDGLVQQRAALLFELQAPDALELRRKEREQLMYLVLRGLFPDFEIGSQLYIKMPGTRKRTVGNRRSNTASTSNWCIKLLIGTTLWSCSIHIFGITRKTTPPSCI
jgi:hypothetical protein